MRSSKRYYGRRLGRLWLVHDMAHCVVGAFCSARKADSAVENFNDGLSAMNQMTTEIRNMKDVVVDIVYSDMIWRP